MNLTTIKERIIKEVKNKKLITKEKINENVLINLNWHCKKDYENLRIDSQTFSIELSIEGTVIFEELITYEEVCTLRDKGLLSFLDISWSDNNILIYDVNNDFLIEEH